MLNEERKILFVEYNIVPNLWKYIFWFEVSPKKVSSLSFKNIFEVLCVKICVWQQNGIEKYQVASITSLLNVIRNVKCSNLVNSCEISSAEMEPQWLCIMSSFNVINFAHFHLTQYEYNYRYLSTTYNYILRVSQ